MQYACGTDQSVMQILLSPTCGHYSTDTSYVNTKYIHNSEEINCYYIEMLGNVACVCGRGVHVDIDNRKIIYDVEYSYIPPSISVK